MKLDHLVWASRSLDDAVAAFAGMSGVEPMTGGRHVGLGSRNALVDLGDEIYLAIDGPDPEQTLEGNYGATLAALAAPVLSRFAVQTGHLSAAQAVLDRHGFATEIKPGGRTGANGERYEWQTLAVPDRSLGAGMPIIKTWLTPSHPSSEAPSGCRLVSLNVEHPRAEFLRGFYDELGLAVPVTEAEAPRLVADIEGRKGRFVLSAG
ncbi:hypothetical protein DLJ53_10195 [Acuticoccus sediminis]|uniref:Glyoxalase-like domain-containing protein n=1 Tax=Acuticoccus sediminis TaxID=2184697 RepID=A0A8B2P0H2_9HYPH|nr:VOC family protein [Acuticoccus sediminis]RAI01767.1 hypothetical protein DLJ53_10195 [Acuticoccus sediminis]